MIKNKQAQSNKSQIKEQQINKSRRGVIAVAVVALLVLIAAIAFALPVIKNAGGGADALGSSGTSGGTAASEKAADSEVVGTYKNATICFGEMRIVASKVRSDIISEVSSDSSFVFDENFWDKVYDGKVIRQWFEEQTKRELFEMKEKQLLAQENGLLDEIDFASFANANEDDNAARKAKINAGEPVYGPEEYSIEDFYDYIMKKIDIRLVAKLYKFDNKVLKDYYKKHLVQYKLPNNLVLQITRESGTTETRICNFDSYKHDSEEFGEENMDRFQRMKKGAKLVIDAYGEKLTVMCKRNTPGGVKSFKEAKKSIYNKLAEREYKKMISANVDGAEKSLESSAFEKVE